MGNVLHLVGSSAVADPEKIELNGAADRWPCGFDVGIEMGLAWLELLEQLRAGAISIDAMMESIRRSLLAESLVVLAIERDSAKLLYTHLKTSAEEERSWCRLGGFYDWMARIRFAHVFASEAPELKERVPPGHPAIQTLVAVPCRDTKSRRGCLAALNIFLGRERPLGHKESLALALAAAVLGQIKEF